MTEPEIRLVIVDDHAMMRQLLSEELDQIASINVVASFSTGEELLARVDQIAPDLVVMDITLPGIDGIETAIQMAGQQDTEIPVLCLTMHLDGATRARAEKAAIAGYAVKHDSFDELVKAVRLVAAGGKYISQMLAGQPLSAPDEEQTVLSSLTARERQIVTLIADGLNTSDIASILQISVRTVDFHRRNIATKTGFRGVADLTRFAVRQGLISGR